MPTDFKPSRGFTPEDRLKAFKGAWGGSPPTSEECLFLSLPPAKQDVALLRLPAVRSFLAGATVTHGEVEARLGVSRPFFYKLASSFRRSQSIGDLVPWSGVPVPRGRTDDENALVRRVVDEAVNDRGPFGPKELAMRFRRELGDCAPATATAKAMAAAAVPRVLDGFRLLPRWATTGLGNLPSAFGELLLMEQVPIERSSDRFLSMVLDARTRFVLGAEDGVGGPGALLRALLDAAENAADGLLPLSRHTGRPTLRAASGRGPEWAALCTAISQGFAASCREADAFRSGVFAQRLLGGRMAWIDLSLVARRKREEWSNDDVAYAVRAHNRSRLILHPELDEPLLRSGVAAAAALRQDPLVLALLAFRRDLSDNVAALGRTFDAAASDQ